MYQNHKKLMRELAERVRRNRYQRIEEALGDMRWCMVHNRHMERELTAVQIVYNQFMYSNWDCIDMEAFMRMYRKVVQPFWYDNNMRG